MLESLIGFIDKLINEFSWKKIFYIVLTIFLLFILFFSIDFSTKFFSLQRLEKEVYIYEQLCRLDKNNAKLNDIKIILIERLYSVVNSPTNISDYWTELPAWFLKGFSLMYPWIFLLLLFFRNVNRAKNDINTIYGVLLIMFLWGIIGIFIPVFWGDFFRYVLFPWIVFFVAVISLALYGNKT